MEGKNGSAKTHKVDFPWDFFLAGSGAWRWVPTYSHLSEKSSTMKKKHSHFSEQKNYCPVSLYNVSIKISDSTHGLMTLQFWSLQSG